MEYGTETSATTTTTSTRTYNYEYLKTPEGVLKLCESIFGLLCWSLVAATPFAVLVPAWQFVLFVSITSWLLALGFSFVFLTGLNATTCSSIPWTIVEFLNCSLWSVMYFLAACVAAAFCGSNGRLQGSTAFAFFSTFAYVGHGLLCYKKWRGAYPWSSANTGGAVSA